MPNPIPISDTIPWRDAFPPEAVCMTYDITYEYGPTGVGASVPALPGCIAVAPTYEQVRMLIREAITLHLAGLREDDGPWPDVIDQCPCPDCATPLLWTRLHDVRTAWQVHHCPPREEPTP